MNEELLSDVLEDPEACRDFLRLCQNNGNLKVKIEFSPNSLHVPHNIDDLTHEEMIDIILCLYKYALKEALTNKILRGKS